MTTPIPAKSKIPEAKELLKEYEELPALIQERVGKKFSEQAKYFMAIENQYAATAKLVSDLLQHYESSSPDAEVKTPFNTATSLQKKETAPPTAEPQIMNIEEVIGENSIAYAIRWVTEMMRFIETLKTGFDQSKQNFNTIFEDLKRECQRSPIRILLPTLHQMQHPEEQKNPNFHADLRKGGIDKMLTTENNQAEFINLSQIVFDERIKNMDFEFVKYETLIKVIDDCYVIIAKLYSHIMQNATKDLEIGTDTKSKSQMQMEIVKVFIQQKNTLETYRFHFQKLNELTLNLLYIQSREQNIVTRAHTLYAMLLKNIFKTS